MAMKVLRTLATIGLFFTGLSWGAADAATYRYDLGNGLWATGKIITDCNNCALTAADIVSWWFVDPKGPSTGADILAFGTILTANPYGLDLVFLPSADFYFASSGGGFGFASSIDVSNCVGGPLDQCEIPVLGFFATLQAIFAAAGLDKFRWAWAAQP
jgi:hypothetical protein